MKKRRSVISFFACVLQQKVVEFADFSTWELVGEKIRGKQRVWEGEWKKLIKEIKLKKRETKKGEPKLAYGHIICWLERGNRIIW